MDFQQLIYPLLAGRQRLYDVAKQKVPQEPSTCSRREVNRSIPAVVPTVLLDAQSEKLCIIIRLVKRIVYLLQREKFNKCSLKNIFFGILVRKSTMSLHSSGIVRRSIEQKVWHAVGQFQHRKSAHFDGRVKQRKIMQRIMLIRRKWGDWRGSNSIRLLYLQSSCL